jgi:hypothetical protein
MKRILLAALLTNSLQASDSLFIEAEAFETRGGWSVDSQFILNMGSAYLMAHGLGSPVADASTEVTFPSTGTYHLHVRTKDWVAKWEAPGTPGKFKVSINEKPATTTFGTKGADWQWQDGGTIEITSPKTTLKLHDLTGFNGRCDALYFTKDANDLPPNEAQALFEFRRQKLNLPAVPPIKGDYDLVVVGGGYSGLGAAISAARHGLKVALIHDRAVLGGNGSSEVQVWAMGGTQLGQFPHLGEIVNEFSDFSRDSPGLIQEFVDDLKEKVVRAEDNIDLYLNHFAFQTNAKDNRVKSVDAVDTTTGRFVRIQGNLFCDATGHGTIGAQAGAKFMMAEKGHMGMSNMWSAKDAGKKTSWPETPWALPLGKGDYPSLHGSRGPYAKFKKAEWFWEGGYDKHPIDDLEEIRDWNLRANFGAFSDIKKSEPNTKLMWMAYIGGNRESRRLEGDLILTGDDIAAKKVFPDASVPTTWSIDLHYPKKEFMKGVAKENPFIAIAVHDRKVDRKIGYNIPYRCFYSKNIENLFMAGRCVSVDRRALGTTRVMRTCGMMGEVVGKAAWIATSQSTTPRGVYQNYLPILIDLIEQPGRARRASLNEPLTVPPIPDGGLRVKPTKSNIIHLKGLVIDDTKAKLTGKWSTGQGLKPYHGLGYQYAPHPASAIYKIRIKQSGKYEVRIHWLNHENRTTAAELTLSHAKGKEAITLDQTKTPAQKTYTSLGTFEFVDVLPAEFKITSKTPGNLHIDTVQLLKVE